MKKILFLLMITACLSSYAQEKQEDLSKSKTVELLQKDGVLLKKDFYQIGDVPGVNFQNIVITNVATGEKTGALRLKTSYYSSLGSDTYIGLWIMMNYQDVLNL